MAQHCSGKNGREYDFHFDQHLDENKIKCVARMKRLDKNGKELDEVCDHRFTYEMNEQGHSRLVIAETSCEPVNFAFVGGLVILASLLLGAVVFVVIKSWFVISDRRIMAEFTKHENMTKYEEMSPLYKSPWTEYTVPEEYRRSEGGADRESFVVRDSMMN